MNENQYRLIETDKSVHFQTAARAWNGRMNTDSGRWILAPYLIDSTALLTCWQWHESEDPLPKVLLARELFLVPMPIYHRSLSKEQAVFRKIGHFIGDQPVKTVALEQPPSMGEL